MRSHLMSLKDTPIRLGHGALRPALSLQLKLLSVGVLVDGDVSNGPGLAAIRCNQVARGAIERQGVLVVGVGGALRELGVCVVVRGHGAAVCALGIPLLSPSPDYRGRSLLGALASRQ